MAQLHNHRTLSCHDSSRAPPLVVGRARTNGFEFRRWYTSRLGLPWISAEAALALLDSQRRYYALIFSHEFAQTFWKPGADITFDVPPQTFQRVMPDGTIRTVKRKPYMRRSTRPNAWKYHLRQMAVAEEPLRYLRKYLHIEEDFIDETDIPSLPEANGRSKKNARQRSACPGPVPTDPPRSFKDPTGLARQSQTELRMIQPWFAILNMAEPGSPVKPPVGVLSRAKSPRKFFIERTLDLKYPGREGT